MGGGMGGGRGGREGVRVSLSYEAKTKRQKLRCLCFAGKGIFFYLRSDYMGKKKKKALLITTE